MNLTNKAKLLSFAYGISDYKDYYTDTTVKFVLSLTEDKLAEAEQAGLHKKFKLEAAINTSNMVSLPCYVTSCKVCHLLWNQCYPTWRREKWVSLLYVAK